MTPSSDPPSIEALLEHGEFLRGLAARLVRDPGAADDLVQETWISALERPPRAIGSLRAWLAGVLRNLARERARGEGRRARRERDAARPERDPARTAQETVERIEAFRSLAADVVHLDEPYRTTLVLRYFEGLDFEEIAAREGAPAATIRSRHKRALERLREDLDRRHGRRATWEVALIAALGERGPPSARFPLAAVAVVGATLVASSWLIARRVGEAATAPAEAPALAAATEGGAPAPVAPADPRGLPATDAARAPREPALLAVPAAPPGGPARAAVALRLVDATTGDPLPEFAVELRDAAGTKARAASDASGRLATDTALAPGRLSLYLIDHPALAAWREARATARPLPWVVQHEHAGAVERELALAVGPTFALELALPSGAPAIEELEAALRSGAAGGPLDECVAPLRGDAHAPWVRFSNDADALASGTRTLEVRDRAGLWSARSPAPPPAGRGAARVSLALAPGPRAALAVATTDERGEPLAAALEVEHAEGRAALAAATRHELRWLPPGAVRVRASAPGRAAASLDLALAPLERVERAVALAPDGSAPAAALRGVLRARSGRAPLDAEVVLFDARGTAVARRAVERDADPALARFAFEGLAPGGYEVRATARSIYRWSPASLAAHAPSHGLELAGDDLAPTRVLVFRARDAADGRELPQIEVVLAVDGHEEPIARTSALGAVTYAYVPADARLAWTVAAEGHALARGDERDLAAGERADVVVALERGFEREVAVVDARGAPVEGAEVQADGAEVARTGADGRARVRLPSPPRELTVPGARALPRGLAPGFRLLHVVDGTSRADLAPGSGTSGGR